MAFRKTHGDNPEKLLFLDIDGVLNSSAFYKLSKQYKRDKINNPWYARQYDLNKLQLLKEIHDRTKCTIVMSSSWRGFYFDPKSKSRCGDGCNRLKRDLKRLKIIIRYRTSNNYDKEEYDITLESTDATPKNLKSLDNIVKMVERKLSEKG